MSLCMAQYQETQSRTNDKIRFWYQDVVIFTSDDFIFLHFLKRGLVHRRVTARQTLPGLSQHDNHVTRSQHDKHAFNYWLWQLCSTSKNKEKYERTQAWQAWQCHCMTSMTSMTTSLHDKHALNSCLWCWGQHQLSRRHCKPRHNAVRETDFNL